MKVINLTFSALRKEGISHKYYTSFFLYIQLNTKKLFKFSSNREIHYYVSILIRIFISGCDGKTTDFAKNNLCYRTTVAHFLNNCKWNNSSLSDTLKSSAVKIIYPKALQAFLFTNVFLSTNDVLSCYIF